MNTDGLSKEEVTVGRFTEFLALCGKDCSKDVDFNRDYMNRLGDVVYPIPNAIETIKALKGRVKQFIATNGLVIAQSKKIVNSGLDKLVDGIYISEDTGYDKPDKRYFDYIFSRENLSDRSKVLIVGDSLINDMQGAENAGISNCWYNPLHKVNNKGVIIDYEIDDIAQVSELLLD